MKTATAYSRSTTTRRALPCPNAATKQDIINRLVDMLLMGAIGMALAAMLLIMPLLA